MKDFMEVVSDIPIGDIPYHLIPQEVQWVTHNILSGNDDYTVYVADGLGESGVSEALSFLSGYWKGTIERLSDGETVVSTHCGLEKVYFVNIRAIRANCKG